MQSLTHTQHKNSHIFRKKRVGSSTYGKLSTKTSKDVFLKKKKNPATGDMLGEQHHATPSG